ncbi:MAG: tripartite tricarboxylate transporter substrate binding protein [Burkholderiaceae bacterium]|jgi:tripartite-type tricarboxylate transporter receptor subunit TctC|nr:tripartite tricarboxylate transporter substrate binding protein [Burkholderiaceae bacterium]
MLAKTHLARFAACVLFAASALAGAAQAQTPWPARPLTIIVPGAPGGTTDIPARVIGQKLSPLLGQPVIVDNKPGGGGILGTQALLRAPADGYTLLLGNTGSHAINYSAYKQLSYKPRDFLPLTDVISFPNVLVVNAQSPIKSVAELIAELKNNPGKLSFASAGIGQTTHLTGELFTLRTQTQAIHVPYRGATPATTSVLSGETTFMFDNLVQSLVHIRAGKLRALAVTSGQRQPDLPDVPTMAEAGVNDFVVNGWLGFFVAADTPPPIAAKLGDSLIKVLKDPDVVKRFTELGGIPGGQPQAAFAELVERDRERWAETIKASNVQLD